MTLAGSPGRPVEPPAARGLEAGGSTAPPHPCVAASPLPMAARASSTVA